MKQHRQSYLMNNDQRGNYIPTNFNNQSMTRPTNTYDIIQEQKLRFDFI
jgi:hypothetical protein